MVLTPAMYQSIASACASVIQEARAHNHLPKKDPGRRPLARRVNAQYDAVLGVALRHCRTLPSLEAMAKVFRDPDLRDLTAPATFVLAEARASGITPLLVTRLLIEHYRAPIQSHACTNWEPFAIRYGHLVMAEAA